MPLSNGQSVPYHRNVRRTVAIALFLGGLWLATFPFVSVWRSTGTALDALPVLEGDQAADDRNWDAMFSSGLVVANREHDRTDPDRYRKALVANGFESASLAGEVWWMKECCGDYGYVQAQVEESAAGGTAVTVALYDNDVQATWPIISGLGFLILLIAGGVYLQGSSRPSSDLTPTA